MQDDINFWGGSGTNVGMYAGRDSMSSRSVVEDVGNNTFGERVQNEIESIDSTLGEEFRSMVSRLVSKLEETSREDGGHYVSDVFGCGNPERAASLAKELAFRARSFRRSFIGIFIHNDHVHAIHDCAYSNKSCRCAFKEFPEAKSDLRRLLRKPPSLETFQRRDWENITIYFCTKGRRPTFFKIGGTIQRLPSEITSLSDPFLSGENEGGSESSLENCHDPIDYDHFRKRDITPKDAGSTRMRKRRRAIEPGGADGFGGNTGIILDLIKNYAICPLSEIVYTKEYLEKSVAIKRLDDREVKNVIDTHASIINTWKRDDFINFYNNPLTIKVWSARSIDQFDNYYLSYEDSQDIINLLLDYQLDDMKYQFVYNLINVIEMAIPKCNCFLIISPPSAGKNFFVDAIKDYFLNVGQMQNPNKYNTFAYQDCHNRRMLIWNEPNYEPRETENLKLLFGGDNLSANVKCKPQANVKRTPIICLSNNTPRFIGDTAFDDRVIYYYWKTAGFLKDCNKKPRPDAVMNLLYSIYNKEV